MIIPDWYKNVLRINKFFDWIEKQTSHYKELNKLARIQEEKLSYIHNQIYTPALDMHRELDRYLNSQNKIQRDVGQILRQKQQWINDATRLTNLTSQLKPNLHTIKHLLDQVYDLAETNKIISERLKVITRIENNWKPILNSYQSTLSTTNQYLETINKFSALWDNIGPINVQDPNFGFTDTGAVEIDGIVVSPEEIEDGLKDISNELEEADEPVTFLRRLEQYYNKIPVPLRCILLTIIMPNINHYLIQPAINEVSEALQQDKNEIVEETKERITIENNKNEIRNTGFIADYYTNVYSENNLESAIIAQVNLLQVVMVLNRDSSWVNIEYSLEDDQKSDINGWVKEDSIILFQN